MESLTPLIALILGFLVGWIMSQRMASRERKFLNDSRASMEEQFRGIAQSALLANNDQFLHDTETKLQPLSNALEALEKKTNELEGKRSEAYGKLSEQIKGMMSAAEGMVATSDQMQSLLKGSSQVRGNWGELLLRNVVEFAGMEEHVHFNEQVTTADGQRPDMTIKLPGGDGIPVDSKCPFSSFEKARGENNPEKVRQLMGEHAKAVMGHVKELGRRDYSKAVNGKIDFTVMFMPGDHLLEAALSVDPNLQDEAMRKKVLITNPVSLVALLRTVRIYWHQEEADRNATKVADAARELYSRCYTWMEHIGKIGKGLDSACKNYNSAVGSWEKRIKPAGKAIKDLKVSGLDTISLADPKKSPCDIPTSLRELQE